MTIIRLNVNKTIPYKVIFQHFANRQRLCRAFMLSAFLGNAELRRAFVTLHVHS